MKFTFAGVQVNAVTTLKRIPMRYETKLQQSFDTIADSKVFIARLNCPNIMNAEVLACAELPNNWDWNPDHGIVKLSLFNQRNTDNVSILFVCTFTWYIVYRMSSLHLYL